MKAMKTETKQTKQEVKKVIAKGMRKPQIQKVNFSVMYGAKISN